MRTDIKQAMHMEAAKSFGAAEANENERRWDRERFDQLLCLQLEKLPLSAEHALEKVSFC
ncbi:MAG: hypothetical protein J6W52_09225 [Bacteroidaceae bacterium]|nr:hypothetical protein [Bacteroidaceae bacterium]